MANWWDAAPLAQPAAAPAAGANWWEAAPLAQEAKPAQAPKSAEPTVSMPEAIGRGAAQGATFNFYDELRGLIEASGANPRDPASLGKLLQGAYKYWTGDEDAVKRYETAKSRETALTKQAEEQRPYSSLTGNVAGAIAVPVGAALQAATLPARIGRGALVGAATGAAAGAGEGEGALDRTVRGASGAAIGAGVGAVLPVGIEGVTRGLRGATAPLTNAVRGVTSPDDEAARRVVTSLQRDVQTDPAAVSRLTPQEFAGSGSAAIMDVGGETTRALARSAANTSPEGRAALGRTIDNRFEGQSERLSDWLNQTFHYPNAQAQQQALDQVERTVNRAGYARAYRAGDRDIMTPELERLLGAPAVADAMRSAVERGQNRAITQGLGAFNPRVTVENGVVRFNRGANGAPAYPNIQLWDYTHRELRDAAQAAFRAGRNEEGGALTALSRTLRAELDRAVPEFGQARGVAQRFFQAENALEAGQNFVGAAQRFGIRETRQALARMTPQERQLFQDGYVSRFVETINKTGDRRNVLNQIGNSPAAREELEVALGRNRWRELEAMLRVEGIMDLARPAIQGNSTTARQLAELGLAGGTYTIGTGGNLFNPDATAIANAALVYGAARGRNRINENVSRHVAEMLASRDPAVLRRGVQIVARNQQLFNSLRATDNSLARIGGQQSTGLAPMQAAGIGRAEDEQPGVPRPPR